MKKTDPVDRCGKRKRISLCPVGWIVIPNDSVET